MRNNLVRWAAGAALGVLLGASSAGAQTVAYSYDPFFDSTLRQSHAFGLEMIGLKLTLVETFAPPRNEEIVEQIEEMVDTFFVRFAASLAALDNDLAEDLREALEEVAEEVEEGDSAMRQVATARQLLQRAYDLLIPETIQQSGPFIGGVITQLMLSEGGVAEGIEEAIEEGPWEYPSGWVALQRVKVLWAQLEPRATPDRAAYARELLAVMDRMYPTAQPLASFAGMDPEEAEGPTQILASLIEATVDANLFVTRNTARLAYHLATLANIAAQVHGSGNHALALEWGHAIFSLYGTEAGVSDFAEFFAPDEHEEIMELLEALTGISDDDDDDDDDAPGTPVVSSDDDDASDDDDNDDDHFDAVAAYAELADELLEIWALLGGI